MTARLERETGTADAGASAAFPARLRATALAAFDALLPRLALELRARRHLRMGEPELRLVGPLSMPGRLSIDVGANHGVYAIVMARHAPRVLVVEPNPELARLLRRGLPRRCTVLACALSDRAGVAELAVPVVDGREETYLASLEAPVGGPVHRYQVELQRLDDCVREPVGLLKIDVEGHELAVLSGAERVLREDGPNLLIEAEERHRPGAVAELAALLAAYGYRGLFRDGRRLRPIEAFDPALHQDPARLGRGHGKTEHYTNNFVFTRDPALVERLLAAPIPDA